MNTLPNMACTLHQGLRRTLLVKLARCALWRREDRVKRNYLGAYAGWFYSGMNRPISVYRFPCRALTICPQLSMGMSPRRYTEIGPLYVVADRGPTPQRRSPLSIQQY